jgi:hypothetical protein
VLVEVLDEVVVLDGVVVAETTSAEICGTGSAAWT